MGPRPVDLKISTWYQSQEAGSYCHVIGWVPFGLARCPRRPKMPRVWVDPQWPRVMGESPMALRGCRCGFSCVTYKWGLTCEGVLEPQCCLTSARGPK
ncbi:hypothetical protein ACFX2F_018009 [Malus domestica]